MVGRARPLGAADYAILGLLLVNLVWTTFRPLPPVQVDNREITANQQKMLTQVNALSDRIVKLEQHLAALQVLDEELAINPTPKAPENTPPVPLLPPAQDTPPGAAPETPATPAPAGRMVKLHKVKEGDTLSAISKAHYGSANKYMTIFEANRPMLKDPDKIYPGQVLRIPPEQAA